MRTDVETCASTLEFLVQEGLVPGMLPKRVTQAAEMLRAMDKELASLRATLAAKHHFVKAEIVKQDYRAEIRAEFVIADPRRYYGELRIDIERLKSKEFLPYAAKALTSICSADWVRELQEMAMLEIHRAIKESNP
jgi:hypothetical protein